MKNLFFILLITHCSLLIINAQTKFQRTIGGTGEDHAWSIRQTTDGGYAVAGFTYSFGAGSSDFYIVKLSGADGSLQWSRTFGGAGTDIALSMKLTSDGGYVMSGETDSFGAGGNDAIFVMIDSTGALQWKRTFGGLYEDYGECIIVTSDGGYAVGGYTNSFGAGDFDQYIAKFDSGGLFQWMRTIGGTGYDYALCIIQTTDTGYALAGSTSAFGEGYTDFYVVKLNSIGALEWSRTFGGAGGDYCSYIIQTTDGGYILAGVTITFGIGWYDIYIVKLDGNGSLQWSRTIGGTNFEYLYSIIQTTDGGCAIAGSTLSYGAGGYDVYVLKFDGSGNLQWNRTIGGTGDEFARSIIQTTDGGYALTGETQSFGAGNNDMYVVKLDAAGNTCGNTFSPAPVTGTGGTLGYPASIINTPVPTVTTLTGTTGTGGTLTTICVVGIQPITNEIPKSYSLFQNYPNPFNPSTKIRFDIPVGTRQGVFVQLIVFDVLGKVIEILVNEQLQPGTYEIDWSAPTGDAAKYSSGVYFYKIISGTYSETKKMVLLK